MLPAPCDLENVRQFPGRNPLDAGCGQAPAARDNSAPRHGQLEDSRHHVRATPRLALARAAARATHDLLRPPRWPSLRTAAASLESEAARHPVRRQVEADWHKVRSERATPAAPSPPSQQAQAGRAPRASPAPRPARRAPRRARAHSLAAAHACIVAQHTRCSRRSCARRRWLRHVASHQPADEALGSPRFWWHGGKVLLSLSKLGAPADR